MSIHPRLEARVRAQERRQINLDARIEELAEDMEASFKQISAYLGKIEEHNDKVETDITDLKTRLGRLETLLIQVLERLPKAP
jgi:septal ring factor EnvC (AmiA/AmiB activator)